SDIRISGNYPAVEKGMDVQVSDISARPEYAILDKQVEIAGQQVRLNRSELLPKVGIMGSYDYVHGFELNDQMLMDKGSFSVLLNVSIPLFHFGERSNKVRAAKAKLMQSRLEQENMNEQMMLELTQAANNLDEARLESELSDRSLLQAEENMKVSKSQYEVGLETLSDYLEAQALWQQAYETQVDAHFQLYLNYVEYLKAAGALSEVKK
ncbi:TolC family protein, partial [Parabacteroides merdae]